MSELEVACEQLSEVSLKEKQAPAGGSVESRPDLGPDPSPNPRPGPGPGPDQLCVTIGATVPTGFEQTAADEVREKLGSQSRISKDRGKIYFDISVESLSKVHSLRSVDNLFVVVQEFRDYQFKETKEDVLKDFEDLAGKLPWSDPLKVWKINTSFKKKKTKRKKLTQQNAVFKEKVDDGQGDMGDEKQITNHTMEAVLENIENQDGTIGETPILAYNKKVSEKPSAIENKRVNEIPGDEAEPQVLKFRVTCNRAGENHSFTSNEAARDFGGAVQDYFKWKADMTNFDVEVLLNVHNNEIVVGIALTEESLHRRNITHFGPTTLRSTLAYGMLRLCSPQPTDIIVDPMCGTGAIPIEGAAEWPNCYHIAGDNNPLAVKRAANNILSLLTKSQIKESKAFWGLPIDAIQWDICNLPLRTGSVDIIVTDMPFGKRIGSKKKNWNLYPSCLQEMSRVCRPGTGRAVLLTQDRKCFSKALSRMGHVWRKVHTVWVNIGGLHAAVYLLKRTSQAFIHPSEIEHEKGTS